MNSAVSRRRFLQSATTYAAGLGLLSSSRLAVAAPKEPPFKISLAEWSLHKTLFAGKMDHLDFPQRTKTEFAISAVEHVDQFFRDKAKDQKYLADLKKRADDHGVRNVLIMIDTAGNLGAANAAERTKAVENHYQWVEAAKFLGCHSIRVNARSQGSYEEQIKLAADSLRRLSEFAAKADVGVIVENHGGLSSNGAWLAAVMKEVGLKNCGTLPDFGNFDAYDRYQGVVELMPFAKGVSAKSNDFDADGNETHTDYRRMMKIVLDAGYHGYVGVEYEGSKLPEAEGILATKKLLEKIAGELG